MKLRIPTWLVFLFLGIASFAPLLSRWPGWWMAYYGALLVCWVLVAVAAMRQVVREERKARRKLARTLRLLRDARATEVAETDAMQSATPSPRRLESRRPPST
jgi:uncharacterized membrane protein